MLSLKAVYLGNPVWAWMAALLAPALAVCTVAVIRGFLRRRLARDLDVAGLPRRILLRGVRHTSLLLASGIAVGAAGLILTLPDKWEGVLRTVAIFSLAGQIALWLHATVSLIGEQAEARASARDPGSATTIRALDLMAKSVLWIVLALVALHNSGVNITALVAGMGIGGIAVALALQNILADVFSSISIMLDKPFRVGDFIVVGDSMGTVERIGIKTTRLQSLSGEQLVFANSELLKSRIRNFKAMTERRVEFTIGVAYSTPYGKVELVPSLLREIISSHEQVRLERATFKEFGDASLTFECVYFVKELSYTLYLGVQESIHLQIFRRLQEEEIEMAHPNRSVYLAPGVAPVRW